MRKHIIALVAAVATLFGALSITGTAMAEGYATPSTDGSSVSFSFTGLTPNGRVAVSYDTATVSDVVQIASKTFNADAKGTLNVKYVLQKNVSAGTVIKATATDEETGAVQTAQATVPNTGTNNNTTGTTKTPLKETGASVAPYAIAVVLMAAAGIAVISIRKAHAR